MAARVIAMTGPAGSGKTERFLVRYRKALGQFAPRSTLWLAPTWRAAAAVQDRLMAGTLRGCFSPSVMTFERFADEMLRASPMPIRPLGRQMKRDLVRRLIDEQVEAGRFGHFSAIAQTGGLVDQFCDFISELKRLDIWPEQFHDACQARGMTEKDAEFLAVYGAYQERLNRHQLYDAEGRFWSARKLLKEGQRRPFERLRLVVVDGFADFTSPQHEILETLAERVDEVLISLPLEADQRRADLFSKPRATLAELQRRHPGLEEQRLERSVGPEWPAMAHLEAHLFANPREGEPASATGGLEILAAPQLLGEIELIGSRIKRLLTEGDPARGGSPVRPGQIAVVFRSLAEVDGLIRSVFGELGIPFALESGQALDRAPALAALRDLVRLDVEDWPFRGLLAVLGNNYFCPEWPEWRGGRAGRDAERTIRRLQVPGGRDRLLEAIRAAGDRPRPAADDSDDDPVRRTVPAQFALALLRRLAQVFDELPRQGTAGEWAEAWERLAGQTGLFRAITEEERQEQAGDDGSRRGAWPMFANREAWAALRRALVDSDRLAGLLGSEPRRLDRAGALAILVDTLGSAAIFNRVEESGRVRVVSAASVRALRVPYLFFAGLAERSFPQPDRHDRLYGEAESARLIEGGLPLLARAQQSRDEMLLFYEVATRATRRLHLSYPALDERAQPLSPSPYLTEIEQACGPGRIRRTEVPDLSPLPRNQSPLSPAELRVTAVARALEGDTALLAGLIGRTEDARLADNLVAGLRTVESRQDRREFGGAEGILASAAARRALAHEFGSQRTFSATELESYATCPFRFLAERVLKIEPLEDIELAVDYRARGQLVHGALARLHQRINDARGGPTSPGDLDEETFDGFLAETLDALERRGGGPLDEALDAIDRRLWREWAQEYRQQHRDYDALWDDCSDKPKPTWFEVSFGRARGSESPVSCEEPLELAIGGEEVRIAGRIDRLDLGAAAGRRVFNVIDYKTGTRASFAPEAAVQGTALQLPLYVMAAEQLLLVGERAVPWQAGYWLLQEKGFKPRRALKAHRCSEDQIEVEPTWKDLRAKIPSTVKALVEGMRRGQFPVDSVDEQCTRNCPMRTICRINQVRSLEKTWQRPADRD